MSNKSNDISSFLLYSFCPLLGILFLVNLILPFLCALKKFFFRTSSLFCQFLFYTKLKLLVRGTEASLKSIRILKISLRAFEIALGYIPLFF
jgi:hypothetical protein